RARAVRVHVVHQPARVVSEDAAVGSYPVVRERRLVRRRVGGSEKAEGSILLTDLRTVTAAISALNVDVAVDEYRGRGIPALAVHVCGACQRIASRIEDVAVVVARVRYG